MEGKRCALYPCVQNKEGKFVPSNLFKDAYKATKDRQKASIIYELGRNEQFLNSYKDSLTLDENGEPTLHSLMSASEEVKDMVKPDLIIDMLNKQIMAGQYEYNKAMEIVTNFNRNNSYKDEYICSLKQAKDGKYEVSVVARNKATEEQLKQEISNRSTLDRIIFNLRMKGVDVTFLEEGSKNYNGRYSTNNAHRTADGYYNLIELVQGEHLAEAAAEEAGHFAVGALGNSPLVTRLLNLLTPEVIDKIIEEKGLDSKFMGNDSAREVAGMLVGEALNGNIDKKAPWRNLLQRIVDFLKNVFTKSDKREIRKAVIEAERLAENIATDFMSDSFEGSVEEAIKTRETRYSAELTVNQKVFRDTLGEFRTMATEISRVNSKLGKYLNRAAQSVEYAYSDSNFINNSLALQGVATLVEVLNTYLEEDAQNDLNSVNIANDSTFFTNLSKTANKLQELNSLRLHTLKIAELLSLGLTSTSAQSAITGDRKVTINNLTGLGNITVDLEDVVKNISNVFGVKANSFGAILDSKNKQLFIRFLEELHGDKYVHRAARVLFARKKGLYRKDAEDIPIADIVESLGEDISFINEQLTSMADSGNILNTLCDKAVRLSKTQADNATQQYQDKLRILEEKCKRAGIKSEIFCEKSNITKAYTGNIISEYNWGDYENDWLKFRRQKEQEFLEKYKDVLPSRTRFEKTILWDNFFKPLAKEWHQGDKTHLGHSTFDKKSKKWVPNLAIYRNVEFDYIKDDPVVHEIYTEYMNIKADLDSELPKGATKLYRLPQFEGSFTNKLRNKSLVWSKKKALGKQIWESVADTFCENSEDRDYGSELTYNSVSEDSFTSKFIDSFDESREKVRRIPLFGINKLNNPSKVSTDIFSSTTAYASMAFRYASINNIAGVLEVGRSVIKKREGDKTSRVYSRYDKFIDKFVYSVGVEKVLIGGKDSYTYKYDERGNRVKVKRRNFIANKISQALNAFGSRMFLGGNVAGGIVNTGTGCIEVFKEAFTGQFFTMKDAKWAVEFYFKNLPENWSQAFRNYKDDTLSLLVNKFDAASKNDYRFRNWRTRDSRARNFADDFLMLPYSSGDHFMQVIPYLAIGHSITLYDKDGNTCNLIGAYLKDTVTPGFKSKDLVLSDTFKYKSADSAQKVALYESIKAKIKGSNSLTALSTGGVTFTVEEQDFIDKYNADHPDSQINTASPRTSGITLDRLIHKEMWSSEDETTFTSQARNLCNKMHGIYNLMDKTMFHQNFYGQALLAMRGYALGMLEKRYAKNKWSESLGCDVEGYYLTLCKAFMSHTLDDEGSLKQRIFKTIRCVFAPFGDNYNTIMKKRGFSDYQISNLKRSWIDMIVWTSLELTKLMLSLGWKSDRDDDDEDKEKLTEEYIEEHRIQGLLYYFVSRWLREQSALSFVYGIFTGDTVQDMKNLGSLIPMGVSALITLGDIFTNLGDEYAKNGAPFTYKEGDDKGLYKAKSYIPYLRFQKVWDNPYKAAQNYDYGRKSK